MKISANKFVTVDYKLNVKTEDGTFELMEETAPNRPLQYFHGRGMMLPKFEEQMEGKVAGETFEFMIACDDAYGQSSADNIIDLPRNIFEQDGKIDAERIYNGAIVPLVDNEGQRINAEIVSVNSDSITVDLNHPLAGEDLYFSVVVRSVSEPTEEEFETMMRGNCGCGCGCNDSNCEDPNPATCGCGCGCGS
jgi:FKBP-type peptidyl-prolyl cis-trans isomerase SlyD